MNNIAADLEEQLFRTVHSREAISIALDECKDINNVAQLRNWVCVDNDLNVTEHFLDRLGVHGRDRAQYFSRHIHCFKKHRLFLEKKF